MAEGTQGALRLRWRETTKMRRTKSSRRKETKTRTRTMRRTSGKDKGKDKRQHKDRDKDKAQTTQASQPSESQSQQSKQSQQMVDVRAMAGEAALQGLPEPADGCDPKRLRPMAAAKAMSDASKSKSATMIGWLTKQLETERTGCVTTEA